MQNLVSSPSCLLLFHYQLRSQGHHQPLLNNLARLLNLIQSPVTAPEAIFRGSRMLLEVSSQPLSALLEDFSELHLESGVFWLTLLQVETYQSCEA